MLDSGRVCFSDIYAQRRKASRKRVQVIVMMGGAEM